MGVIGSYRTTFFYAVKARSSVAQLMRTQNPILFGQIPGWKSFFIDVLSSTSTFSLDQVFYGTTP